MEGGSKYPWKWSPLFKDYYMFRPRGVAGTADTDLIWARSLLENAPGSPDTSTPPTTLGLNEGIMNNTRNLLATNHDRPSSSFQVPNTQLPSNTEAHGQFRELSQIPMDLTNRAINSSSPPLYGWVVPFTSLGSADGSTTTFNGPRTVTPATTVHSPSPPYPEPSSEHGTARYDEGVAIGVSPVQSPATPNIDTHTQWADAGFQTIQTPRKYFKKGRVFKVSWPEPKGETALDALRTTVPDRAETPTQLSLPPTSSAIDTTSTIDGNASLHVKVRMFVVIRSKAQHCLCLPIYTYSQQGTSKSGVKPEDHAPLVKENSAVEYHPDEQPDKLKKAIYLILEDTSLQWSPLSRISLTKVQSVEYNLKVRTVGRISQNSLSDLEALFREAIGIGED